MRGQASTCAVGFEGYRVKFRCSTLRKNIFVGRSFAWYKQVARWPKRTCLLSRTQATRRNRAVETPDCSRSTKGAIDKSCLLACAARKACPRKSPVPRDTTYIVFLTVYRENTRNQQKPCWQWGNATCAIPCSTLLAYCVAYGHNTCGSQSTKSACVIHAQSKASMSSP